MDANADKAPPSAGVTDGQRMSELRFSAGSERVFVMGRGLADWGLGVIRDFGGWGGGWWKVRGSLLNVEFSAGTY